MGRARGAFNGLDRRARQNLGARARATAPRPAEAVTAVFQDRAVDHCRPFQELRPWLASTAECWACRAGSRLLGLDNHRNPLQIAGRPRVCGSLGLGTLRLPSLPVCSCASGRQVLVCCSLPTALLLRFIPVLYWCPRPRVLAVMAGTVSRSGSGTPPTESSGSSTGPMSPVSGGGRYRAHSKMRRGAAGGLILDEVEEADSESDYSSGDAQGDDGVVGTRTYRETDDGDASDADGDGVEEGDGHDDGAGHEGDDDDAGVPEDDGDATGTAAEAVAGGNKRLRRRRVVQDGDGSDPEQSDAIADEREDDQELRTCADAAAGSCAGAAANRAVDEDAEVQDEEEEEEYEDGDEEEDVLSGVVDDNTCAAAGASSSDYDGGNTAVASVVDAAAADVPVNPLVAAAP